MSAAHTPGPWAVHPAYPWIIKQDLKVPFADIEDGLTVCNTTGLDGSGFFPSSEEGRANARLIAAAPELLEALEEARAGLLWYQDRNPGQRDGSDDEAMARIDAAIAKATGSAA